MRCAIVARGCLGWRSTVRATGDGRGCHRPLTRHVTNAYLAQTQRGGAAVIAATAVLLSGMTAGSARRVASGRPCRRVASRHDRKGPTAAVRDVRSSALEIVRRLSDPINRRFYGTCRPVPEVRVVGERALANAGSGRSPGNAQRTSHFFEMTEKRGRCLGTRFAALRGHDLQLYFVQACALEGIGNGVAGAGSCGAGVRSGTGQDFVIAVTTV